MPRDNPIKIQNYLILKTFPKIILATLELLFSPVCSRVIFTYKCSFRMEWGLKSRKLLIHCWMLSSNSKDYKSCKVNPYFSDDNISFAFVLMFFAKKGEHIQQTKQRKYKEIRYNCKDKFEFLSQKLCLCSSRNPHIQERLAWSCCQMIP